VLDRGFYCIGELLMFLGCLLVLGDYLCFLGFLWVWGASFVSWVFVGGLPLFFGFHGAYLCFFFFFFWWASWVVHVYTSCVLRGALRFFNKIFLLIKKNYFIHIQVLFTSEYLKHSLCHIFHESFFSLLLLT
jgi:hypothetical protein